MIQQKSETFKPGESEDHMFAVTKVFHFLEQNKKWPRWFIDVACPVTYPPEIIKQLPKNRVHKGHTFDLGIYEPILDSDGESIVNMKPIAYIEINGNIGYDYYDGAGRIQHANPTKHSKELQKRNDKINKNYCENAGIIYKTLLKEEVLGNCTDKDYLKDSQLYLNRELLEFIK